MGFRRFIAGAALAAAAILPFQGTQAASVATTDEFLEATIQVERRIRVPQGGASTRIHVNVGLKNLGDEDLIIKAPGDCAIHNWAIVLPNNDPVVVKADKTCPGESEVTRTIPAGGAIKEGHSMNVRGGLLEPGRRYYIIYEFWGVRIRTPFRIFEDQ
ncbi:hypothetical protein [Minwuia sp.]|uniref:hypothetical protein n=1 Tax=Minwuia sp. TaxID=2493630 RepID=UPI003A906BB5